MSGLLLAGDLYFNRIASNVKQGFLPFGNATSLKVKENADRKDRPSKGKSTYGQNLNTVFTKKPAEISIEVDTLNHDNIALAWMGDVVDVSVASGSFLAQPFTVIHDAYIQLNAEQVSALLVQDVTDTTTYVVTTDYELLPHLGLFKALSSGNISDGEVLHIGATFAGKASKKITGGTNSSIKMALLLDGRNLATGYDTIFNGWEAVLTPEDGVDMLSGDFESVKLSGTLNLVTGKPSPYEYEDNVVFS